MRYILLFLLSFFNLGAEQGQDALLKPNEIAVVSMAIGATYYEAVLTGVITKQEYCAKHGYDFVFITESLDTSRPHAWSKIKLIQQILSNYRWVFWTDADALIMNSEIRLESLIDENYSLIITGDPFSPYCTGHFLLKNCDWSFALLNNIYTRTETINHNWWEQKAFVDAVEQDKNLLKEIKVIPQRMMNSFDDRWARHSKDCVYQDGDFIIHFAATRKTGPLKEKMQQYFNKRK